MRGFRVYRPQLLECQQPHPGAVLPILWSDCDRPWVQANGSFRGLFPGIGT